MIICPTCGAQSPEGAVFCDECGASLKSPDPLPVQPSPARVVQPSPAIAVPPAIKNCPVCGARAQPGGLFCENCGASLAPDISQQAPAQVYLPPTVAIPGAQVPVEPITAPEPSAGAGPIRVPSQMPTAVNNPKCVNCGAILEPDSAFCDMCGTPVKKAGQFPEQALPAAPPANALLPEPAGSAGFEPTVVGRPEVAQQEIPSQVDAYGTQQQYAATQVGAVPPPQNYEQPQMEGMGNQPSKPQAQTAGYGVPPSYEQPKPPAGFGAPSAITARFVIPGTNISFPFQLGKVQFIVGREDPIGHIFPEIDLTDHGGDQAGVSRQHARITIQGNQYYITDLQSTNYTYVNQQRLQPNVPTLLHDGDEVQFGRLKLLFYR